MFLSEVKSVQGSTSGIFCVIYTWKVNSLTDPQLSPIPAACQTSSSPFYGMKHATPPFAEASQETTSVGREC